VNVSYEIVDFQIESLQNCLIEVKEKHRKDIEDLTKSFLAQKSIPNGAPESSDEGEKEQLRIQVTISYFFTSK
jgi:hypothetical protein